MKESVSESKLVGEGQHVPQENGGTCLYIYILAFVINRSPRQTRGDGERGRSSFSFSAGANTRERVALLSPLRAVRKPPRVFCLGKGQPKFQCVLGIDIPGAKFCGRGKPTGQDKRHR